MLIQNLPVVIFQKAYEADQLSRQAEADADRRSVRGAPRTPAVYKPPTLFVGNSESDVKRLLDQFEFVIGPKARGNKRRGSIKLYGELLAHFKHLQNTGVQLPRGGNISREMIAHGLGQVLRELGCTNLSDWELCNDMVAKRALGKKMDRIFKRIVIQLDADIGSG
jgi:hypothetical protein